MSEDRCVFRHEIVGDLVTVLFPEVCFTAALGGVDELSPPPFSLTSTSSESRPSAGVVTASTPVHALSPVTAGRNCVWAAGLAGSLTA